MKTGTIIVGGGLAGLSCAVKLHGAGRPFHLFEASDGLGGRVRTDTVDGFRLDRGFQVFLDSYANAGRLLDLEALDLRSFIPGADVWKRGRLRKIRDVFRQPFSLLFTALQPVGTVKDKWLVAQLRMEMLSLSAVDIWTLPDISTAEYLHNYGFSKAMIDDFFRSFYGGIFLEKELATSVRMFAFTFKNFAKGCATLPAKGMQAIPDQLATRLPATCISTNCHIRSVDGTHITTAEGTFEADRLVIATDGSTAARWFPGRPAPQWRTSTFLYFASDTAPVQQPVIVLQGDRKGLINNLCVPSLVSPKYAPKGQHLVSVTVLGEHENVEEAVDKELFDWFGEPTKSWRHLQTQTIRQSLPVDPPGHLAQAQVEENIYFAGDYTTSSSTEGAILSGLRIADKINSTDSPPRAR